MWLFNGSWRHHNRLPSCVCHPITGSWLTRMHEPSRSRSNEVHLRSRNIKNQCLLSCSILPHRPGAQNSTRCLKEYRYLINKCTISQHLYLWQSTQVNIYNRNNWILAGRGWLKVYKFNQDSVSPVSPEVIYFALNETAAGHGCYRWRQQLSRPRKWSCDRLWSLSRIPPLCPCVLSAFPSSINPLTPLQFSSIRLHGLTPRSFHSHCCFLL